MNRQSVAWRVSLRHLGPTGVSERSRCFTRVVFPSFIDCHMHLVGQQRVKPRMDGISYDQRFAGGRLLFCRLQVFRLQDQTRNFLECPPTSEFDLVLDEDGCLPAHKTTLRRRLESYNRGPLAPATGASPEDGLLQQRMRPL